MFQQTKQEEDDVIECDECGCRFEPITDAYRCPECGAENYPDGDDDYHRAGPYRPVFTNCNVCGVKLRTVAEDQVGMCERCADE